MEEQIIKAKKLKALDMKKWQDLISDWEKTKESQKSFCLRLGLNINTFTYIRGKLSSDSKKQISNNHFIPVKIKNSPLLKTSIEQLIIENINGIKLHIPINLSKEKLILLFDLIGWQHA